MDETGLVSWDDVADVAETGGFAAMSPEEAFTLISDAVQRPMVGDLPLDPLLVDTDPVGDRLLSLYLDSTSENRIGAARAFGDWVRSGVDANVAPALSRASALPEDAYEQARALGAGGDSSLMLDLYSNFLASL